MAPDDLLAAFDAQTRRDLVWDAPGAVVERVDVDGRLRVVRFVAEPGQGWSAVIWSDLADLPSDQVDAVIAAEAGFFAARGVTLEWKHYGHDLPADLPDRLLRAGFEAQEPETLVVARVAELADQPVLPDGVRLVEVTDEAGLRQVRSVAAQAFGEAEDDPEQDGLYASLAAQLRDTPDRLAVLLALAGDQPVSQARIEFPVTGEFAGLWGGGTVPGWGGRGIYRALVARRAALAAERGFAYLTVDASPESRPILQRLGFSVLSVTTPYLLRPPTRP